MKGINGYMEDFEIILPDVKTDGDLGSMRLPDIGDYNFWEMYKNRIICLDGEITDWDYHIVKDIVSINLKDINKPIKERKPIIIMISSNGGLLDITNSIIDVISISKTPVWTVNMGQALSGGCLIFLAGDRRFTTPNSWVMCHSGSGGLQGNYADTKEAQKVWDAQVKNMGDYIISRTGIDTKTYNKYKNKDWYLNMEQQLQYGFATEELKNIDDLIGEF